MQLDHLAVAGESLAAATAHVEAALGVPMQPGGQHQVYGTHNTLLGLADGLYLEAIAIDPTVEPERRPRWFDLDRFIGSPRIGNWICRCTDLPATLERLTVEAGQPVALSRGDLRWDMAVPSSGILPFDNLFPALMQWHGDHPAARLTQQGCRLKMLTILHPAAEDLGRALAAAQPDLPLLRIEQHARPMAVAEIETPHGLRVLQ